MRNLSLKKVRRAAGEVYGLENAEPASSTVGGHEEKGAARKGALPVVLVVVLVALTLAVGLAGFAVQSAEAQTAGGPVVAWGGGQRVRRAQRTLQPLGGEGYLSW